MSKFKQFVHKLSSLEGSTKNVSLSFAIGVLIGFSPFIGLHTIIALTLCLLTTLNKPALMIGCFLNMPWIVIPYYSFATWMGSLLLGIPGTAIPTGLHLSEILSREFAGWIMSQWVLLLPAFAGSFLLASILAVTAYITATLLLAKFRSPEIVMAKKLDN